MYFLHKIISETHRSSMGRGISAPANHFSAEDIADLTSSRSTKKKRFGKKPRINTGALFNAEEISKRVISQEESEREPIRINIGAWLKELFSRISIPTMPRFSKWVWIISGSVLIIIALILIENKYKVIDVNMQLNKASKLWTSLFNKDDKEDETEAIVNEQNNVRNERTIRRQPTIIEREQDNRRDDEEVIIGEIMEEEPEVVQEVIPEMPIPKVIEDIETIRNYLITTRFKQRTEELWREFGELEYELRAGVTETRRAVINERLRKILKEMQKMQKDL